MQSTLQRIPATFFWVGIWAILTVSLTLLSRDLGLTWDEVTYINYSKGLHRWAQEGFATYPPLSHRPEFDRYLNPHPPLMKIISALGGHALRDLLDFPTAYRVGHHMMAAFLVCAIGFQIRRGAGSLLAFFGCALILLQPRFLGNGLLATADAIPALCWALASVCCWRIVSLPPERRAYALYALFIVAHSIGAAIKITGLLLLIPSGITFLAHRHRAGILLTIASTVCATLLVALISPEAWRGIPTFISEYLTYPLHRDEIPITTQYFGRMYSSGWPWHYFFVMTGITTPLPLLAGFALFPLAFRLEKRLAITLSIFIGVIVALFLYPKTPRHDEVRQFLPLFPLMGIAAALGWISATERIGPRITGILPRRLLRFGTPVVIGIALLITTLRCRPLLLSYYNELIGGFTGAVERGMEVTLYFEHIEERTLRAINDMVPPNASISIYPRWPDLLVLYQQEGKLRSDLMVTPAPPDTSEYPDFLVLSRRRSILPDQDFFAGRAIFELKRQNLAVVRLIDLRGQKSGRASRPQDGSSDEAGGALSRGDR